MCVCVLCCVLSCFVWYFVWFYMFFVCCSYLVLVLSCVCFSPPSVWGLLDFRLNSSLRPELFSSPGLLLETPWSAQPRDSLECPTPEIAWSAQPRHSWSAQPQSLPGVPNPETPWSAQTWSAQPRVSLECPTPGSPWSAQPQLQAKSKKAYLNQCVFV